MKAARAFSSSMIRLLPFVIPRPTRVKFDSLESLLFVPVWTDTDPPIVNSVQSEAIRYWQQLTENLWYERGQCSWLDS